MSHTQLIQSAINISEGRNSEVITSIVTAAKECCLVADWSADVDHNRMVVTLLGNADEIENGILSIANIVVQKIDMRNQSGLHPRIGALDVVPLTPIRNVQMADCITLSEKVAQKLSTTLQLPTILYEYSARNRHLALPDLRKGGVEALYSQNFVPADFGPRTPHPTAGATVIGARDPLAAWNLWLQTDDLEIARDIASDIRSKRKTDIRLKGIRAIGLSLRSICRSQISMNVTMPDQTPLKFVLDAVITLCSTHGASIVESEIIGLISHRWLAPYSANDLLWFDAKPTQYIEHWLDII